MSTSRFRNLFYILRDDFQIKFSKYNVDTEKISITLNIALHCNVKM